MNYSEIKFGLSVKDVFLWDLPLYLNKNIKMQNEACLHLKKEKNW